MQPTATHAPTAVDVARSFFAAYNAHDVNRMLAACAEDAQLRYVPLGAKGRGPIRQVGKAIWSGILDAFPDLTVAVESAFSDGRNVAAEVLIGGTQQKNILQVPNRGRRYELPHAFLLQVDDRRLITKITAYWDNASFYSQLGKTTLE